MKVPKFKFRMDYLILLLFVISLGRSTYVEMWKLPHNSYNNFSELADDIRAGKVLKITVEPNRLTVQKSGGVTRFLSKDNDTFETLSMRYKLETSHLDRVTIAHKGERGCAASTSDVLFSPGALLALYFLFGRRSPSSEENKEEKDDAGDDKDKKEKPRGLEGFFQRVKEALNPKGIEIEEATECATTFADVAGLEPAKEELRDIIVYIKNPESFERHNIRLPRGILFTGDPGTGKTLLARALAGELKASFFTTSGSQFVDVFGGLGARNVRDLFARARQAVEQKKHPAVIFIDEIDAVGGARSDNPSFHPERDQTLNQLLVEMDGLKKQAGIIVIAATNRPDMLDPALLRPGRFDRKIHLELPDRAARFDILTIHARQKPLAPDVSLLDIAARTAGVSGAQLESLMNEAGILMLRQNETVITNEMIAEATDKVLMGVGNGRILTPEERERTACHEAGHTLVGYALDHCDPVRRVSIVARGEAGGFTMVAPEHDDPSHTKEQLEDILAMTMAGYAAEVSKYGESGLSTGAASDLERAEKLAWYMVTTWGMKREVSFFTDIERASEARIQMIEKTVNELLTTAYGRAFELLKKHELKWKNVADALIEKEVLDEDDLERMLDQLD